MRVSSSNLVLASLAIVGSLACAREGSGSTPPPPEPADSRSATEWPPGAIRDVFDGPAPDSGRFEPGTGWWCLGQSVAFTCFRAQTACEQKLAEINQSDAAEGEVSLTDACMQVTEVYCRTAISIEDQAGTTACFRNRLTCEEDGKGLAGSGYYEDVSGCGAIQ